MRLHWLFTGALRRQLSISLIILVIIIVSTIGFTSIQIAQQVIRNHTVRFGGKMLTQAAYRLGSVIDNAENTVDSLILDRRLAPLLHDLSARDRRVSQGARQALHELLLQYQTSLLPGAELIVISPAGDTVTTYNLQPLPNNFLPESRSTKNFLTDTYLKDAYLTDTHLDKPKVWRLRYYPFYQNSDSRASGRLLQLTARIISLPGQSQSGWIILHLDYRIVESIMTNISLLEDTLSRSRSDVIVYGPEKQIIFPWVAPSDPILDSAYQKLSGQLRNIKTIEEKVNGISHLIIAVSVPWTPWEVYISAPTSRLYAGVNQIYNSVWVIGFFCAIFAILAATMISFFVTKPVNKLRKVMRMVEEGNLSVIAPESGPLEIQSLGRAFNRMLHEVDRLTKRLVAEESERRNAVIKALQAQIAPHFLFNTLAAMAGMTAKRPPAEVAEALRSLKRLLHLSIGKDGAFVTLADEFEHVHHYLYLMNIRYPGRYFLQMDLPPELRRCRIIRLVLQPLVENCIQHGFKLQGGLIRVWACRESVSDSETNGPGTGDAVLICVKDNGQGMSPEKLHAVWSQNPNQSGVGVRNVDERLKLTFGPDYGLTLDSSKGEGTTVSLRIPFEKV
ncbi:MAG TPA: sensor histidine kinase [Bacillota bacterium]|nr:sensor histidine kinase [Bacillota bacterium]